MTANTWHPTSVWFCPTCEEFISNEQMRATQDHYNRKGFICQWEHGEPRGLTLTDPTSNGAEWD